MYEPAKLACTARKLTERYDKARSVFLVVKLLLIVNILLSFFVLQFVLFLFGFLISLSSVRSLQCYQRFRVGGHQFPIRTMTCGTGSPDSQCVTVSYLSPNLNDQHTGVVYSTCGTNCNENEICSRLQADPSTTNCRVTCCQDDLCNAAGK